MNRFEILKLPDDYIPYLILTPEEKEMVREEVEGFRLQTPQLRRVQFPLFEISSNPVIPLQQIRERRYDLIERAQSIAQSEFFQTSVVSDPADTSAVIQETQEQAATQEFNGSIEQEVFSILANTQGL